MEKEPDLHRPVRWRFHHDQKSTRALAHFGVVRGGRRDPLHPIDRCMEHEAGRGILKEIKQGEHCIRGAGLQRGRQEMSVLFPQAFRPRSCWGWPPCSCPLTLAHTCSHSHLFTHSHLLTSHTCSHSLSCSQEPTLCVSSHLCIRRCHVEP